jgi:hypothetical protein
MLNVIFLTNFHDRKMWRWSCWTMITSLNNGDSSMTSLVRTTTLHYHTCRIEHEWGKGSVHIILLQLIFILWKRWSTNVPCTHQNTFGSGSWCLGILRLMMTTSNKRKWSMTCWCFCSTEGGFVIFMLAYGVPSDIVDEIVEIGENTGIRYF